MTVMKMNIGGPVEHGEGGVRRDARLLQVDQRADHAGHGGGQDIDGELDPIDVDAEARGVGFMVADRAEGQPAARPEDEIDKGQRAGHQRQRTAARALRSSSISSADSC
jgi:hypothetical protein